MKLVVVLLSLLLGSRAEALEPVNPIVGDAGFVAAHGRLRRPPRRSRSASTMVATPAVVRCPPRTPRRSTSAR